MDIRRRRRREVDEQLAGEDYRRLLLRLQKRQPLLSAFQTWGAVWEYLGTGNLRDPRWDIVLQAIFRQWRADADPKWQTVVLAAFWPSLVLVHSKTRSLDRDEDERGDNVLWFFLSVIHRIDIHRRPERLAQKIMNDVLHDLRRHYRRIRMRELEELATDNLEPFEADARKAHYRPDQAPDTARAALDMQLHRDSEVRWLRRHREAGRLSRNDLLVLLGTQIYGKTLEQYAREAGIPYETAKKRRQRALAKLRRIEAEEAI